MKVTIEFNGDIKLKTINNVVKVSSRKTAVWIYQTDLIEGKLYKINQEDIDNIQIRE